MQGAHCSMHERARRHARERCHHRSGDAMNNFVKISILTVVLIAGQAIAQKQPAAHDSLGLKPALGAPRAKLNFLVGSFATETILPPGPSMPQGATGKGSSVISWALDSTVLLIDEQSLNTLFGQYKGHGVLAFDAPSHRFVLSMFNNFGDHPTYNGNFVGDTLVLETEVRMPKHPFYQKLVWYKDGDALKMSVLNNYGEGFVLVVKQTAIPIARTPR